MSNEMAVTAVTLALQDILAGQLADKMDGAPADVDLTKQLFVTALPPNKVRDKHASENVVNLFLYRTEVSAAWRNMPLPRQSRPGEPASPPLAIHLEYLVTAYGEDDRELAAQFLIGQAMRVLHDRAMIPRERLQAVLESAHVHDQIEAVTITPRSLSIDDISKLWGVFQTQYRISAAYLLTVLLIESRLPVRSPLPVLRRGPQDEGPIAVATPPAFLEYARPRSGFAAVVLDEDVVVTGDNFSGGSIVARLRHLPTGPERELPVTIESGTRAIVRVPAAAVAGDDWRAGFYALSFVVSRPGLPSWATNEVPVALAPQITVNPTTHGTAETIEVTIVATPRIGEEQNVAVIYGSSQIAPKSRQTPADATQPTTVTADVALETGKLPIRLRVDGVDSIPVIRTNGLASFDPAQSIEV